MRLHHYTRDSIAKIITLAKRPRRRGIILGMFEKKSTAETQHTTEQQAELGENLIFNIAESEPNEDEAVAKIVAALNALRTNPHLQSVYDHCDPHHLSGDNRAQRHGNAGVTRRLERALQEFTAAQFEKAAHQ